MPVSLLRPVVELLKPKLLISCDGLLLLTGQITNNLTAEDFCSHFISVSYYKDKLIYLVAAILLLDER